VIRALALYALVAGLLAAPALAAPSPADLEAELVCPVCGTTLDQSDAPVAQRMKQIVRQRLAEGATEAQIKAELVDQFGAGGIGVGLLAWGWRRRHSEGEVAAPAELDPELERRLDAELRRFDP
jgi:hypothetical protein